PEVASNRQRVRFWYFLGSYYFRLNRHDSACKYFTICASELSLHDGQALIQLHYLWAISAYKEGFIRQSLYSYEYLIREASKLHHTSRLAQEKRILKVILDNSKLHYTLIDSAQTEEYFFFKNQSSTIYLPDHKSLSQESTPYLQPPI